MGKPLLILAPGEPLALMKKFPYFDNLVEFYVLSVSILCLGVHDFIHCIIFKAIRNDFNGDQLLDFLRGVQRGG